MNKKLLLATMILVLVSIYWFKPLSAQTLPSEDEIEQLKSNPEAAHRLLQGARNKRSPRKYSSQEIFSAKEQGAKADEKSRLLDSLRGVESDVDIKDRTDKNNLEDTNADEFDKGNRREELRPFGYELFQQTTELTSPVELANAEDYVLGPGDNVIIYLWGRVERELNLTVDREGKVFVPPIGEMVVWGKTVSDFQTNLRNTFSEVYSEFKMNITLGKIRSIRVYLVGEVNKPGAYTVSSLTTLFNALYQAGGPSERGSMRKIKLLRGGTLKQEIDLYDFLARGDNSIDVRLKSGDAIFVPIVGAQVAIEGEVKRPAIYELQGDETGADILALAGGATAEGYLRKVTLKRVVEKDEPRLLDIDLDSNSENYDETFAIRAGDHLTVQTMYDVQRNFVAVGGMVKHKGRFERSEGLTLKTLLERAQLRPEDVYLDRLNVFRTYPDNRREVIAVNAVELLKDGADAALDVTLMDRDSVHVYAINQIERVKHVYIDGEVRRPGEYLLYDGMTLEDLIFLAGNMNRAAYLSRAEIACTDSLGGVSIKYVELVSDKKSNTLLSEDDIVSIRQIPEWELHRRVTIEGEVLFPGEYTLASRDETLWSALMRTGGFTEVAFPAGLVLERKSISSSTFSENLNRLVRSNGELREDSLGQVHEVDPVRFDKASLDRIILDMTRLVESDGREGDLILQPGDKIYVPQTPPGVSVLGAVGANGTIKYESSKRLKYYLERAGGYTRQADKDGVRLVRADGRVFSGGAARKKEIQLGDAIVVPTEIKKEKNLMQSVSSVVSIVSGLATSVFIITKL
jgi:protein involved in polysaccharide export with SLBB domain